MSKIRDEEAAANRSVQDHVNPKHEEQAEIGAEVGAVLEQDASSFDLDEITRKPLAKTSQDEQQDKLMTSDIARTDPIADQKVSSQSDHSIDDVVAQIHRVERYTLKGRLAGYQALSLLYPIVLYAEQDSSYYEEIRAKAATKARKNTPVALGVIHAVHKLAGKDTPSSTKNEWSTILQAARVERVKPTAAAMGAWLQKLAGNKDNGKTVYKAARDILNSRPDDEVQPASKSKPREILEAIAHEVGEATAGVITPRAGSKCPQRYALSLSYGDKIVRFFEADDEMISRIVTTLSRKTSGGKR